MVITVCFTIQDANNNLNKCILLKWLFRGNIEKHLRETEKPLNSFPGSPFFPCLVSPLNDKEGKGENLGTKQTWDVVGIPISRRKPNIYTTQRPKQ